MNIDSFCPDGLIPELQVADIDNALSYYRDVLGFSVEGRHQDESREALFGSVLCGKANIYFSKSDQQPAPTRCWVGVNEVDRLSNLVAAHGTRITDGVADKPWGCQFTVPELDGNLLTFFLSSDEMDDSVA